ncbi:hypothetical protein AAAC51_27200, partial [Priestia megaterium]
EEFIDKIYISPFAPDWFCSLIKEIIQKRYELNIEVEKSEIKISPTGKLLGDLSIEDILYN